MMHGHWRMPKLVLATAGMLALAGYPGIAHAIPSTLQTTAAIEEAQGAQVEPQQAEQAEQELVEPEHEVEQKQVEEKEVEPEHEVEQEQAEHNQGEQNDEGEHHSHSGDHEEGGHGGESDGGHD